MRYLVTVSICWVALYLLYALWLRKETFFTINRGYLIASLLSGLLIPVYQWIPTRWWSSDIVEPIYAVSYQYQAMWHVSSVAPSSSFNWLLALYVFGVIVMGGRMMYGLYKIFRLSINAQIIKRNGITLYVTDEIHLPFSFWKSMYLSKHIDLKAEIDHIVKHEITHINAMHTADILLVELLHVFFWFNPILIFYRKALQQAHEFAADSVVLQHMPRHSYGQLLLQHSQSGLEMSLANHFFHSQIKKRITMMYQEKSKKSAMVKYLAAAPVLICLAMLFSSHITKTSNNWDPVQIGVKAKAYLTANIADTKLCMDYLKQLYDDNRSHAEELAQVIGSLDPIGGHVFTMTPNGEKVAICMVLEGYVDKMGDLNITMSDTIPAPPPPPPAPVAPKAIPVPPAPIAPTAAVAPPPPPAPIGDLFAQFSDNTAPIIMVDGVNTTLEEAKLLLEETIESVHVIKGDKAKAKGSENGIIYIQTKGKTINRKDIHDEEVFKLVDRMPRFPGCNDAQLSDKEMEQCAQRKMLEYVYKNIKYPAVAKENGVEGITVIQFQINKTGQPVNAKIIRDPGSGLGDAALAMFQNMVDEKVLWEPGEQNGKKVAVQYNLPIRFKLESDEKSTSEARSDDAKSIPSLDVKLYPNPTAEQFSITVAGPRGELMVTVADISGRILYDRTIKDFEGSLNHNIKLNQTYSGQAIVTVKIGDHIKSDKIIFK